MKKAVLLIAGKQYFASIGDTITSDNISNTKVGDTIEANVLMRFDTDDEKKIDLGKPYLKEKSKLEIVQQGKGNKVTTIKFKSKVRYHKKRGFKPHLTQLKVLTI